MIVVKKDRVVETDHCLMEQLEKEKMVKECILLM